MPFRSFKVIEVSINRKSVCDFPLVINTNSYLVPFQSYRSLLFKFWKLCVFEPPFGGVLRTTYGVHLRLNGKPIVNFLLVLTEHFSLGVTAEAGSAIWLQRGQFDSKFQVEGVAPPIIFCTDS